MGTSLHVEGQPWGVLTLDALEVGTFGAEAQSELRELIMLVEAALRTTRLEAETRALRLTRGQSRADGAPADNHEILGQSEPIARLLHEIDVVSDSELPILLLGETGVGKELFAHRVHRLSRRRAKPLVHVNCAALPESLAESELFGHAKGAFSGAVADRPGRFEAANGGTLFLDEVGELPLLVQAKLLRALQNGEIQRLGDDRPRRVDVRIVAATNRSLKDLVRDGDFRADLYHRLSVYPIAIPPLRARQRRAAAGRPLPGTEPRPAGPAQPAAGAGRRRGAAPLPLAGQCARAGACHQPRRHQGGEPGRQPQPHRHAGGQPAGPVRRRPASLAPAPDAPPATTPDGVLPALRDAVDACQRQHVRLALQAHDGNWAAAARVLEVDPSNLHKLARRLGLKG